MQIISYAIKKEGAVDPSTKINRNGVIMPGFDKTGPQGQGSMTGKGMGSCDGDSRRGAGRCCDKGRFVGRTYLTKEEETQDLKAEAQKLEADLKAVNEKISELNK